MARLHRTSVIARNGTIRPYHVANCWCGWQITNPHQHVARQRAKQHEAAKNRTR